MFAANESLPRLVASRLVRWFIRTVPSEATRCRLRAMLAARRDGIPVDLLCREGETVLMVGVHRIDTAIRWSLTVGAGGRVALIEALPRYLANIRDNLQNHLNWELDNITYVPFGVGARSGRDTIEIGRRADFNKLAEHGVDDRLGADEFVERVEIDVRTLDEIVEMLGFDRVDHVTMTISGLELEALDGMSKLLMQPGLRLHIRSLHTVDGQPLYKQVAARLSGLGYKVAFGRPVTECGGRNIYAYSTRRG